MGFTFVSSASNAQSNATSAATTGISVAAGDLLLCSANLATSNTCSVSDSSGNTYGLAVSDSNITSYLALFYAVATVNNPSLTITASITPSPGLIAIVTGVFSATATPTLDLTGTNFGTSNTPSVSVKCSGTAELAVATFSSNGLAFTSGAGFQNMGHCTAGVNQIASDFKNGVSGTQTDNAQLGSYDNWVAVAASFYAGSVTPPAGVLDVMMNDFMSMPVAMLSKWAVVPTTFKELPAKARDWLAGVCREHAITRDRLEREFAGFKRRGTLWVPLFAQRGKASF